MAGTKQVRMLRADELLLQGHAYSQVVAFLVEEFGCSEKTGKRDIAAVYARWAEDEREQRPHRKARLRQLLNVTARRALDAGDFSAVVSAARQLAKIDGLEAPKELAISGALDIDESSLKLARKVQGMTAQEKAKRRAELLARAAESTNTRGAKPKRSKTKGSKR